MKRNARLLLATGVRSASSWAHFTNGALRAAAFAFICYLLFILGLASVFSNCLYFDNSLNVSAIVM